ncbi:MAG: sigma-70 family RNA polymerase sigma factor [Roseivirga sp.]|nr:sigma-70 family RNA polymerase sigma factor [Roseivirga sp.]
MRPNSCIDYILSSDKRKRAEALEYLYENCFPKVAAYIQSNSGTEEEAKDFFQDTIAVVYKNLLEGKFRGESAITSYTYAVARNLWLQQIRKRKIVTTSLENDQLTDGHNDEINANLIREVLARMDVDCRSFLTGFYYNGSSMEELARRFGLSSTQVARTKKLRCMKKLGEIIQGYGLKKDHFII